MKIKILTEAKKRRQLPEKGGKTPIRTTASFPQIIAEARRNDIIFKSWKKRTVNLEYYIHWEHLSWMKRKSPQKKRKLKDLLLPHRKEMRKAEHLEIGRKKEQRKEAKPKYYIYSRLSFSWISKLWFLFKAIII